MGWLEMERLAQDAEVAERCGRASFKATGPGEKWAMTRAALAEFVRVLRERERDYGSVEIPPIADSCYRRRRP